MFNLPETVVKNEQPFNFPIKLEDVENEQAYSSRNGESDNTEEERVDENQTVKEMEDEEDGC